VCQDGFTDVWKGRYQGRDVAAQVLRLWPGNDPGPIRRVRTLDCYTY